MGLDGWGNDLADRVDGYIDNAQEYWRPKEEGDPDWWTNGVNNTIADVSRGAADLLRVGSGLGQAIYAEDKNIYGRMAFAAMDISRGSSIFVMMAGPFAGMTGASNSAKSCPIPRKTLKEQADELVKLNGGKNSVTLRTPTKQIRYDLIWSSETGHKAHAAPFFFNLKEFPICLQWGFLISPVRA